MRPNLTVRPLAMGTLLLCGALVVTLSMGIRHGFGLWLQPIIQAHGWLREDFALAMALQNLVWGATGPFVGIWADRHGAWRVLTTGALLYAIGLVGMATASHLLVFNLATGLTIGLAQACSTYAVVYGVIGRHVSAERRSWAMGLVAAAGSFGQFLMVPVSSILIGHLGWSHALMALGACALLIIPAAAGLKEHWVPSTATPAPAPQHTHAASLTSAAAPPGPATAWAALMEALRHRDYALLTAGYFVCGFQVAFIAVHFPSYLRDHQLAPQVATTALALIGLFNVLGTYTAGVLGQRLRKNHILSAIYLMRTVVMFIFISLPITPLSVGIFAAVMGALWLSTVPPTNAVVAQMMGVRHLSMLGGVTFFSHQIGSFLGVWLAGRLYDASGSYQIVWWLAMALGIVAGLLNLPIHEHRQPARRIVAA